MVDERSHQTLGRRMTAQRKLLLEIIRDAGSDHLDADELFRRAREREPRISLSTVYRNLNLLSSLGVVTQDDFSQDHRHYEINTAPGHHHLVCRRCGEIFEFESPLTETMKQAVQEASHFEITDVRVTMQGLCPSCQGENL